MADTTIRKSVFLATDKPTVWAHLTRADLLGKWYHPAEADLAEGEADTLVNQKDGDRMFWGSVERADPHDCMKWSFTVGPMQGAMSTVEWRLEAVAGSTRLSLDHSGLPSDADCFGLVPALDKGRHGFLMNLRELDG